MSRLPPAALVAALALLLAAPASSQPAPADAGLAQALVREMPGVLAVLPPRDGALPVLADRSAGADLPPSVLGWRLDVDLVGTVRLMGAGQPPSPDRVLSPEEAAGLALGPPPEGPAVPPTIQDGIGPGSALQQSSGSGTFICSASFLLRHQLTGVYYLSTAGHCLVRDAEDPTPYSGYTSPDKVMGEISVCVASCLDNALGLGTYVELRPTAGYHPVAFAQSGGVGADFGLIEVPSGYHHLLRPWMPQWGGPEEMDGGSSGQLMAYFGHGSYCCPAVGAVATRTPVDQARVGVSLGSSSTTFTVSGFASGGDSGSGAGTARTDAARLVQGVDAAGTLTHGLIVPNTPYFTGTVQARGLAMAQEWVGPLELVPADDPLAPFVPPTPQLAVASPGPDEAIDRSQASSKTLRGTAAAPGAEQPAVQVAVDDDSYSFEGRVPVSGFSNWSAEWDLHGVQEGPHTIWVRLVDGDRVLLEVNRTVQVETPDEQPAPDPEEEPEEPPSPPPSPPSPPRDPDPEQPEDAQQGDAQADDFAGDVRSAPGPGTAALAAALAAAAALVRRRPSR